MISLIFVTFYIIFLLKAAFFIQFAKRKKGDTMNPSNYLVIICDQLSAAALRTYGNSYSHTPNLDRLAERSAVYENAYTPCPLCQPARASFWTSRYPHETMVRSNLPAQRYPFYQGDDLSKTPETFPTISEEIPAMGQFFSNAGYTCVHFGKTHDYGALKGFQVVPDVEIKIDRTNPAINFDYETYLDVDTTQKTVRWLKNDAANIEQPFLAVADLQNPHNICGYIGENQNGVNPADFPLDRELPPLPENFEFDDIKNRPPFIQYLCCAHRRLRHASRWTPQDYQYYLYAYYYYLNMVDKQIGEILQALEESGKADNTAIFFFADHGEGMAAHHMVTKYGVFYEESNRVPFFACGPGIAGGRRIGGMFSLLDLLPTMLDHAGILNQEFAGTSQLASLKGACQRASNDYVASEWHDEFRDYTIPGRMICDENFKYTCYLEPDSEELFDLRTDRLEKKNLARLPEYASVLETYRQKLKEHVSRTNDDFFRLACSDASAYRHHPLGFQNHEGLSAVEVYSQSLRKTN